MEQLLLSVPNAAAKIGIGRSLLYEILASGQIESVKCGRRRLIVASSLEAWAASLPTSQLKPATKGN